MMTVMIIPQKVKVGPLRGAGWGVNNQTMDLAAVLGRAEPGGGPEALSQGAAAGAAAQGAAQGRSEVGEKGTASGADGIGARPAAQRVGLHRGGHLPKSSGSG